MLPERRQPILLWAIRRFLTAFSNSVLMLLFTVSSWKPEQREQSGWSVVTTLDISQAYSSTTSSPVVWNVRLT